MARPARWPGAAAVSRAAAVEIGATGSIRAKAAALAAAVAALAVDDVTGDPDDLANLLALAETSFSKPNLHRLATGAENDVAAIVRKLAIRQFEARGFRPLSPEFWQRDREKLRAAVAQRLSERLRKDLK